MSNNPNSLSYLVSNIDIVEKTKLKSNLKIVQYKDLFQYSTIFELLPSSYCFLVILINTSPQGGGHWVCLTRQKLLLTYFDSYGKGIDKELVYISKYNRQILHETKPYLSMLINKEDGFKVVYNTIHFQQYSNAINTCGKYVVFVINSIKNGLNLKEIQNVIMDTKQKNPLLTYDHIINYYYHTF